jgi:hypothetical protein
MQPIPEQILIKMENSPYYVVQPPLYDWNNLPNLLEPWRYQLASNYNAQYNREHNIDDMAHLCESESYESD